MSEPVLPIYRHEMPSAAWQLLWWMICRMDAAKEIHEGWRIRAARELKKDRVWIGRCAQHLQERKLIETAPRRRYARVCVENLVG